MYTVSGRQCGRRDAQPSRCCEGTRVQAHRSQTMVVHSELDPALLAFVKCHITSFVKWDILRSLSEHVGFWTEASALAREMNRPIEKVREAFHAVDSSTVGIGGVWRSGRGRLREGVERQADLFEDVLVLLG